MNLEEEVKIEDVVSTEFEILSALLPYSKIITRDILDQKKVKAAPYEMKQSLKRGALDLRSYGLEFSCQIKKREIKEGEVVQQPVQQPTPQFNEDFQPQDFKKPRKPKKLNKKKKIPKRNSLVELFSLVMHVVDLNEKCLPELDKQNDQLKRNDVIALALYEILDSYDNYSIDFHKNDAILFIKILQRMNLGNVLDVEVWKEFKKKVNLKRDPYRISSIFKRDAFFLLDYCKMQLDNRYLYKDAQCASSELWFVTNVLNSFYSRKQLTVIMAYVHLQMWKVNIKDLLNTRTKPQQFQEELFKRFLEQFKEFGCFVIEGYQHDPDQAIKFTNAFGVMIYETLKELQNGILKNAKHFNPDKYMVNVLFRDNVGYGGMNRIYRAWEQKKNLNFQVDQSTRSILILFKKHFRPFQNPTTPVTGKQTSNGKLRLTKKQRVIQTFIDQFLKELELRADSELPRKWRRDCRTQEQIYKGMEHPADQIERMKQSYFPNSNTVVFNSSLTPSELDKAKKDCNKYQNETSSYRHGRFRNIDDIWEHQPPTMFSRSFTEHNQEVDQYQSSVDTEARSKIVQHMNATTLDRVIKFAMAKKRSDLSFSERTVHENCVLYKTFVITGSEVIMPLLVQDYGNSNQNQYINQLQQLVDHCDKIYNKLKDLVLGAPEKLPPLKQH